MVIDIKEERLSVEETVEMKGMTFIEVPEEKEKKNAISNIPGTSDI